jgi:DNA anti-recombination protein RmuC
MRITRFENFLNESINEARDINDPVLLAIRASKEARKKSLTVQKENTKKRVHGKQREKLEDKLWAISQDLKDAYAERRNIFNDMESEAGEKREKWTDDDANRYGAMLNKVDDEIEKLISKRQAIEIKLAY